MKPILFNTEMVKAILDGRKTQTRRAIKIPSYLYENPIVLEPDCCVKFNYGAGGCQNYSATPLFINSPYKVGDILYVRETWTLGKKFTIKPENVWYIRNDLGNEVYYKADLNDNFYDPDNICKWKPSIHMPKKYARIFLKVTNVRVERLKDMNFPENYEAEGSEDFFVGWEGETDNEMLIKNWWINLWDSTAKDGYKWEDNPYVFVYEFERVEK